LIFINSGN